MIKTDGIILDIDGTLWDSTELCAETYNTVFREMNMPFSVTADVLKGLFGLPMDEIARRIMPECPDSERRHFMERCMEAENRHLKKDKRDIFYTGVKELVPKLFRDKKIPLYIVSNCQKGYIEALIEKGGFEGYIRDFESFGNTGLGKADNIRLVAKRNSVKAPVYVGDTEGDRISCLEAGIPFIFAAYGFGTPQDYDAKINSFRELAETVERL